MKKNRTQLAFFVCLLVLSLCYVVLYVVKLRPIVRENWGTPPYHIPYRFIACPVLCFSIGATAGLLVQWWADKPIARPIRITCMITGIGLLAAYAGVLFAYRGLHMSNTVINRLLPLLLENPLIVCVPGLFCSVGIGKNA